MSVLPNGSVESTVCGGGGGERSIDGVQPSALPAIPLAPSTLISNHTQTRHAIFDSFKLPFLCHNSRTPPWKYVTNLGPQPLSVVHKLCRAWVFYCTVHNISLFEIFVQFSAAEQIIQLLIPKILWVQKTKNTLSKWFHCASYYCKVGNIL